MHRWKFILSQFKYQWWYFTIHIYIFFSYMCIIPKYWYQFWYCVIAVHIHETLSSLIKCFDCFFAPPWTNISNLIILTTWTWKIYTILLPTINCAKVKNFNKSRLLWKSMLEANTFVIKPVSNFMSHDYADWAIIEVPVENQKLFLSRTVMWPNCIDSV